MEIDKLNDDQLKSLSSRFLKIVEKAKTSAERYVISLFITFIGYILFRSNLVEHFIVSGIKLNNSDIIFRSIPLIFVVQLMRLCMNGTKLLKTSRSLYLIDEKLYKGVSKDILSSLTIIPIKTSPIRENKPSVFTTCLTAVITIIPTLIIFFSIIALILLPIGFTLESILNSLIYFKYDQIQIGVSLFGGAILYYTLVIVIKEISHHNKFINKLEKSDQTF